MLPILLSFLFLVVCKSAVVNITDFVKVLAPENYVVKIRLVEEINRTFSITGLNGNRSGLQKYDYHVKKQNDWIDIINDNPDFLLQISTDIEKKPYKLIGSWLFYFLLILGIFTSLSALVIILYFNFAKLKKFCIKENPFETRQ